MVGHQFTVYSADSSSFWGAGLFAVIPLMIPLPTASSKEAYK